MLMGNAIELLAHFRKYPVFGSSTVKNKTGKTDSYANLLIHRLRKRGLITMIERDKYTVYKDPFLLASRLIWPSYISCWSALKYHNLTEQVPQGITVAATANRKAVIFGNTKIRFVKLNPQVFFGYDKVKLEGFDIFIANAEKAIIDSALLGEVSISEIKEILENNVRVLNVRRIVAYLKRIGNRSLIKRFGYLLESLGKDYFKSFKRFMDGAYILLDSSGMANTNKNEKWKVVINA
jgi:predicted transcriptional regulator of viral defense system